MTMKRPHEFNPELSHIYLLVGEDAGLATVEVYELEKETEHTLFLRCRSGIRQVRKGPYRRNQIVHPERWYRTRDEVMAAWRRIRDKQVSDAERTLQRLRGMEEPEFHNIPVER